MSARLMVVIVAAAALTLAACGGGGPRPSDPITPPETPTADPNTPPETPTPDPNTPPETPTPDPNTPPETPTPDRSLGMGRISVNPDKIISPSHVHQTALASPRPGSVTQGSTVDQGITADTINLRFVSHEGGVHPIAEVSTFEGETLTSNDDPATMVVHLLSGEVVDDVDPTSDWRSDPKFANVSTYFPQEVYGLDEHIYFSQEFEEGWFVEGRVDKGTDDDPEYESRRREISLGRYHHHPIEGRSIQGLFIADAHGGGSFAENEDGTTRVIGNPSGMIVAGFTDYRSGSSDYVAWGYWAYYKFTSTDLEYTFGAFADGVETAFSDVPDVGSASYSGYSAGLAVKGVGINRDDLSEQEQSRGFQFVGQVNLTADFATASVSGTVGNFRAINVNVPSTQLINEALGNDGFLNALQIDLNQANIRSSGSNPEHSFFVGSARAIGLGGASGKWGGQFFGAPATDEAPPAVGGTWGVTQGEGTNDWKMIGGIGAWKGS